MSNQLVVNEKRFGNEMQPGTDGVGLPWPEGCDPRQEVPQRDPAELFPIPSHVSPLDRPHVESPEAKKPSAVSAASTSVITQSELAKYRQLTKARQACEAARKGLIAKIDQGAVVEPGPLRARIDESTVRILSRPRLEAVLGKNKVRWVYRELEPTVRRCLRVT